MNTIHTLRPATLSTVALFALSLAGTATAATHSVCASGCDYSSIQGAIDASSSGDVLELEPETFFEGDIDIDVDLTLRTSGGFATIDADGDQFTLKVHIDYDVDLEDLVLKGATSAMLLNHGNTTLSTVYALGDSGDTTWGGIFNGVSASLTLTDASVVAANSSANHGGGINNYGDLVINNSTVMANSGKRGGGLSNVGGQVSVTSSSFSFNQASVEGGAWFNHLGGSVVYHTSSSYSANTADSACDKFRNIPTGQCVD